MQCVSQGCPLSAYSFVYDNEPYKYNQINCNIWLILLILMSKT